MPPQLASKRPPAPYVLARPTILMTTTQLRRQSRTSSRARRTTSRMDPILEDAEPEEVEEQPLRKRSSVKARRRHGVSDLKVPSSGFFTAEAVTGWRLALALSEGDDEVEVPDVFEFPAPPRDDRASSSSSSDSESAKSTPATTPTASPVKDAHTELARCKTIKPLTINKRSRSVSPAPLASSPPSPSPMLLPQLQIQASDLEDDADIFAEEDEALYALYAQGYFTLASPLPDALGPSRADSSATRRANRESAVLSRPMSTLLSPPATPPTHSRSSSTPDLDIPNYSRPTSLAMRRLKLQSLSADPRASIGSVWRDSDFTAYAPLISASSSSPSSPTASTFVSPYLSPASASRQSLPPTPRSGSSGRGLLSPLGPFSPLSPRRSIVNEVPSDIDLEDEQADWEDGDADLEYIPDHDGLDVPRTPLSQYSCDYDEEEREREWMSSPSPFRGGPPPVFIDTPVSPCSVFSFPEDSQLGSEDGHYSDTEIPFVTSPEALAHETAFVPPPSPPASPILRSRWSASTLASVRTTASPRSPAFRALRSPASGKTFAFARRYLSSSSSTTPSTPSTLASPSPKPRRRKSTGSKPKTKTKTKKSRPAPIPMGAGRPDSDFIVGRPPAPMSVLAAASSGESSPFAAAWPFSAQWAGPAPGAARYA
ncbi:Vacuolar DHA amino acid exporter [Mycena kentingensis (nom. inval.)]|nr:Vacuolar DHA amino acid exporter [Mycena kentingensis (nom. inval.)]